MEIQSRLSVLWKTLSSATYCKTWKWSRVKQLWKCSQVGRPLQSKASSTFFLAASSSITLLYLSKLSNVFVLPPPLLHFAHRSSSSSVYFNFNLQHGYCYRGIVGACSGEKRRLDGPGVAPRNMVTLRWWKVRLLTIEKCQHFHFGWYINANKFANTGPVFQVMILQRNGVQVHPWAGACMHCIALGSLLSNSFTHSSRGKSSREGGTLSKHC